MFVGFGVDVGLFVEVAVGSGVAVAGGAVFSAAVENGVGEMTIAGFGAQADSAGIATITEEKMVFFIS